ncbi:lysophospholipid acyltransferase family protein [Rhizomonospora bruguierae]|uniref:lysophospholipid acyltransferase family protein n=1 Tax=Rhizomonospora bruguierae TaxID=1581705 RepID=UPI001BCE97EA|nr:lysophospholipid acyltransferase family protein [Micromonospora sp. NBRC 107566]
MDTTGAAPWRPPLVWRVLLVLARALVALICRLRVTGDVPTALRHGPLILAANHISPIDPVILTAACRVRGVAPRIMATGGLFRAPVVGAVMRASGHIRVDREEATVADALTHAAHAIAAGGVVLVYPEGRIGLDPGMWPERGKTGAARLALASGAPVAAVAQWGAHTLVPYAAPRGIVRALLRAMVRRPVVRVHFGAVVDLSGLPASGTGPRIGGVASSGVHPERGAARRATDRIIDAITDTLRPLRPDEPDRPRHVDPTRPANATRTHRRIAR